MNQVTSVTGANSATEGDAREIIIGEADALSILGCGALGTAILLGLLSGYPTTPALPRFIACVRRDEAADAVRRQLRDHPVPVSSIVDIRIRDNVKAVQDAKIVILVAVQPHMLHSLLQEPGMRDALNDKIIISVLAGVTVHEIKALLNLGLSQHKGSHIVRAMPNINCFAKQSTTVIETGSAPQSILDVVSQIFECIGQVFFTVPSTMDACTALCGSTPAFFTVVLEGLVEGAVAVGLKPGEALQMAASAMMGTASLISQGRKPTDVRHEVTSPGGSTIQGVLALEEDRTRWAFARALGVAAKAAAKLGGKDD